MKSLCDSKKSFKLINYNFHLETEQITTSVRVQYLQVVHQPNSHLEGNSKLENINTNRLIEKY